MSVTRIAVHDLRELFDVPTFDPLNGRFEQQSGVERILDAIEDRRRTELARAVEIVLPQAAITAGVQAAVSAAIAGYCAAQIAEQRREIKLSRRNGLQALWLGLPFLAACLALSTAATTIPHAGLADLLSNGLIIAGWVGLWRPIELLLYDRWPFAQRIRLLRRLSQIDVRVVPA